MHRRQLAATVLASLLLLSGALLLPSCGERDASSPQEWKSVLPGDMTQAEQTQQARAEEAQASLLHGMFSVIQRVLAAEGEVPAIRACGAEAISIAHQVADEKGVKIGRTSFRLRNPENAPPGWARTAVETGDEKPAFFRHADGELAALYPIRMQIACVACHGPREEISPELRARLEKQYPEDQALDFTYPGLRGYVWVEVPPAE